MNPFVVIWNEIDTWRYTRRIVVSLDPHSYAVGYHRGPLHHWVRLLGLVISWPVKRR
jgi:hypothetical protein